MRNYWIVLVILLLSFSLKAQENKKALTFDDILQWERITETKISNNGEHIIYKQQPWKGDPVLKITTPSGEEKASIKCGSKAIISADSKHLVYTLLPPSDTLRILKLKKTKKEDMPQNKLVIYNLKEGSSERINNLKSVKVPEEWSGWIAYQVKEPTDTIEKKKSDKKDNYPLIIKNLETGSAQTIPNVSSYVFAKETEVLTLISEGMDSTFNAGVYVFDLINNKETVIFNGSGEFEQLTINDTGDKIAFLGDTSEKEKPDFKLFLSEEYNTAEEILNNNAKAIPENWELSKNGSLSFSQNNDHLFYKTAPKQTPKDTTILDEEIPQLDIWHYKEEILQTVQLHNKEKDSKRSFLGVIHLNDRSAIQLETEQFTGIKKLNKGNSNKILAYSNRPYALQSMWEGTPKHNDFYLIDIHTGESTMFVENCRATPKTSPNGNFIFWYNPVDTTWNTFELATQQLRTITNPVQIQVANELNDIPNLPSSYNFAGWTENDEALLIYDRYDMWKIDPLNQKEAFKLTNDGRAAGVVYRLVRFNPKPESSISSDEKLLLQAHNEKTRADSYFSFEMKKKKKQLLLQEENFKLSKPLKAKESGTVIFTRENFETYPNLIATDLSFKKEIKISDTAPQQKDYNWGTAELVSWLSLDGKRIEGTLHKPENFDPNKKYPLIVNFYEKSSQRLLSYRMPENHRSTIDYHYYTSNEYVIFNPDVYYKEGYPGESAFNCVMPGINSIIEKGFIDEKRIAAQGHSWGGYQVAYLATRTNMFAAIESGAPVVNMFSAYGGIRWGSGLNRSFQYEHTQSRIGKTIWESPLRYVENSPLFTLDKIETPILIMHNDDDGAVPWYQGIEFFIGLRRLGKPSWLLNYNEADHWPTKVRDMHDFQIRMAQFFDHYLKNKPMPKWMKEGIPATKKGIDLGYELVE